APQSLARSQGAPLVAHRFSPRAAITNVPASEWPLPLTSISPCRTVTSPPVVVTSSSPPVLIELLLPPKRSIAVGRRESMRPPPRGATLTDPPPPSSPLARI